MGGSVYAFQGHGFQAFHIAEPTVMDKAASRIKSILDAKYEKANLPEVVRSCDHLTKEEQAELLDLLQRYSTLFDGTLGTWHNEVYDVELRKDVEPYGLEIY